MSHVLIFTISRRRNIDTTVAIFPLGLKHWYDCSHISPRIAARSTVARTTT